MAAQPDSSAGIRRSLHASEQTIAVKALGTPHVFVEALDPDGNKVVERVESEVALLWPFVHKEVVVSKHGKVKEDPVQLPKQVGQDILALLLEYCRYHRFPGRSDKERKIFDEKFIRLDTRRLCELTSAADSLDMKPLVDLSSRALARMIEGKTPEEIRETFHLPDDLTEEEKLEPVKNVADDPRIRLLNRLYAKKRKELAEKKAELQMREAGVKGLLGPPSGQETRSVEELLSFIEAERGGAGKARNKKRKSKKKLQVREAGAEQAQDAGLGQSREAPGTPPLSLPGQSSLLSMQREESTGAGVLDDSPQCSDIDNLDDAEMDDEIEAFERSLKTDWEDRRAELILMAGAFPSRPTRVTNLTSLSNFRARPPLESDDPDPTAPDPQSQDSLAADAAPAQHIRAVVHSLDPAPQEEIASPTLPTGTGRSPGRGTASTVRPFMGGQAKEPRVEGGSDSRGRASSNQPSAADSSEGNGMSLADTGKGATAVPGPSLLGETTKGPVGVSEGGGSAAQKLHVNEPANGMRGSERFAVSEANADTREAELPALEQQGIRPPSTSWSLEGALTSASQPPDVPVKTPPSEAEAGETTGEKGGGDSKLAPLRTLLEGFFPYRKPAPQPEVVKPNGNAPSAGGTAEKMDAETNTVGGGGALAVQIGNAEDLQPATGRGEGVGGEVAQDVKVTDTAKRKLNGEHIGAFGSWEKVDNCSEPPAKAGMAQGEIDGQPQGANVGSVSADTSLPNSSRARHEQVDASGKVNPEALAVLLRDFVRELGCESLVSIQACESGGQLRGVVPIECTVKGLVPGLGSIRLQMESENI